ncbi:MAG: alpha/beta hydrolase family protein [Sporichthyaceae bacterium]
MRRRAMGLGLAGVLAVAGCGGSPNSAALPAPAPTAAAPMASPPSPDPSPSASPKQAVAASPAATDPLSLPALMAETYEGGELTETSVESRNASYVRSRVTFPAGDLTVSGVLLRPTGRGPFPAVVLNHGYIDPAVYNPGQGLKREQDRLARAGFVVLHVDYRGHAGSDDPTGPFDLESRVGYARDAIGAVLALKNADYVDPERVGMFGRSMGGAVVLNALVARPGLVKAAVIYASVSSLFVENVEHFTRPNRPGAQRRLYREFGTPEANPAFYDGLSARTYFDRITEPIQMHHGDRDATCPPRWARETQTALERADVDSELIRYPGEDHTFYAQWSTSMDRSIAFLREHLG